MHCYHNEMLWIDWLAGYRDAQAISGQTAPCTGCDLAQKQEATRFGAHKHRSLWKSMRRRNTIQKMGMKKTCSQAGMGKTQDDEERGRKIVMTHTNRPNHERYHKKNTRQ